MLRVLQSQNLYYSQFKFLHDESHYAKFPLYTLFAALTLQECKYYCRTIQSRISACCKGFRNFRQQLVAATFDKDDKVDRVTLATLQSHSTCDCDKFNYTVYSYKGMELIHGSCSNLKFKCSVSIYFFYSGAQCIQNQTHSKIITSPRLSGTLPGRLQPSNAMLRAQNNVNLRFNFCIRKVRRGQETTKELFARNLLSQAQGKSQNVPCPQ